MRKTKKTLICFLNHFSKVVNVFPQCNSYDFEWFSWFPSFLLLIFNLWLTFQEIWSKWGKKQNICFWNHFSKVVMYFRNAILWFLSGLVDSLSFLLLIFNLWLTFQEIWSKWGKNHLYASESLFKGCNVFPQCNSMIFEWFSWFPIIPVTNFQFVTNISVRYRNEENTFLYASESLFQRL